MRHGTAIVFPTAALAVALCAGEARASEIVTLMGYGTATLADVDGYEIGAALGADEPAVFEKQQLTLRGNGTFVGGGVRGAIQDDGGLRASLGVGFFGISGVEAAYEPLPPDLHAETGGTWGASIELAVGRGFFVGPVLPYLDLRMAVDIMSATVKLTSDAHGVLGSTVYNVASLTMGPRVGIAIPLNRDVFIDFSGTYGLFGAERATFFAGLGLWDGPEPDEIEHRAEETSARR